MNLLISLFLQDKLNSSLFCKSVKSNIEFVDENNSIPTATDIVDHESLDSIRDGIQDVVAPTHKTEVVNSPNDEDGLLEILKIQSRPLRKSLKGKINKPKHKTCFTVFKDRFKKKRKLLHKCVNLICKPCNLTFRSMAEMSLHMVNNCPLTYKVSVSLSRCDDDHYLCRKYNISKLRKPLLTLSDNEHNKSTDSTSLMDTFIPEELSGSSLPMSGISPHSKQDNLNKDKDMIRDKSKEHNKIYRTRFQARNKISNNVTNTHDTTNQTILEYLQLKRVANKSNDEIETSTVEQSIPGITGKNIDSKIVFTENNKRNNRSQMVAIQKTSTNSELKNCDRISAQENFYTNSQYDEIAKSENIISESKVMTKNINSPPNIVEVMELQRVPTPQIPHDKITLRNREKFISFKLTDIENKPTSDSSNNNNEEFNNSTFFSTDHELRVTQDPRSNNDKRYPMTSTNIPAGQSTKCGMMSHLRAKVELVHSEYTLYNPNRKRSEEDELRMIFNDGIILYSKNINGLVLKNIVNKFQNTMPINVTIGQNMEGKIIRSRNLRKDKKILKPEKPFIKINDKSLHTANANRNFLIREETPNLTNGASFRDSLITLPINYVAQSYKQNSSKNISSTNAKQKKRRRKRKMKRSRRIYS